MLTSSSSPQLFLVLLTFFPTHTYLSLSLSFSALSSLEDTILSRCQGPLALIIFLPPLLHCSLSFKCKGYVANLLIGGSTHI